MSIYHTSSYTVTDIISFKYKMLNWFNQFNIFCLLENNASHTIPTEYDLVAGMVLQKNAFSITALGQTHQLSKDHWYFGHLGFGLQADTEKIISVKEDKIGFSPLFLFEADLIITITHQHEIKMMLKKEFGKPDSYFEQIIQMGEPTHLSKSGFTLQPTVSKEVYIETIEKIKHHLQMGDCYEMNYCMALDAEDAQLDPVITYRELCKVSPTPFAALYRVNDSYLICASPERFLRKQGNQLLSQPIKGTIKREQHDSVKDGVNQQILQNSQKEKSENIMIVDLVRNDLSKICKAGSVVVTELLKIYSFSQLHHLISSIEGSLKEGISFEEMIKACFPMGSMTGAPKNKVLQLIDHYETSSRGIFSGSVGYIAPGGSFDFNVVIRSIMLNKALRYVKYMVGSGITIYCDAAHEYEECILKASAIEKVLLNQMEE